MGRIDNGIIYQNHISSISVQTLYCIGGYVTYEVAVSTDNFSGSCSFCLSEDGVKAYVEVINNMIKSLNGEIEIRDCESDAYLKLYFEDTKNFYVLGQIGGSYEDNTLKFKLKADQTILYGLKEELLGYKFR